MHTSARTLLTQCCAQDGERSVPDATRWNTLVLTRKPGEQVIIGGVTVSVVGVAGRRVRFGIDVPDSVRIGRGELPSWRGGTAGDRPDAGPGREPGCNGATAESVGLEAGPR